MSMIGGFKPAVSHSIALRIGLVEQVLAVFNDNNCIQITSASLLEKLAQQPDVFWSGWPVDLRHQQKLARLLANLGNDIRPRQMWLDGRKRRGYRKTDFVKVRRILYDESPRGCTEADRRGQAR